jgi:hypothetical protein
VPERLPRNGAEGQQPFEPGVNGHDPFFGDFEIFFVEIYKVQGSPQDANNNSKKAKPYIMCLAPCESH